MVSFNCALQLKPALHLFLASSAIFIAIVPQTGQLSGIMKGLVLSGRSVITGATISSRALLNSIKNIEESHLNNDNGETGASENE